METQFLLIEKANPTNVLNPNVQPGANITEWITDLLAGLDPTLELVATNEPFATPAYEDRTHNLITNQVYVNTSHPVYSNLKQWVITYTLVKKPDLEIKAIIDGLEAEATETLMPINKRVKLLTLAVNTLYKKVNGLTLDADEQAIVDTIAAQSTKIWKNDKEAKKKKKDIDDGTPLNLDEKWTKNGIV